MKLLNHRNGDIIEVEDDVSYSEVFEEIQTMMIDGQEWILHDGGECPIDYSWHVAVMLGAGQVFDHFSAGGWSWAANVPPEYKVIAYQVISTEKPKREIALDALAEISKSDYFTFPENPLRDFDYNPSKLGEGHGGEN